MKITPKSTRCINLLYLLLYLLIILGHTVRIQLVSSIALYPHDLLILTINFMWFVFYRSRTKPHPLPALLYFVPHFSLIISFSLLFNLSQFSPFDQITNLQGILFGFRWINIGFLSVSTHGYIKNKLLTLSTLSLLMATALSIAIIGFLQYIFLPDLRFLYYSGWDDHLNRLVSTTLDPAFTGLLLLLGLVVSEIKNKNSIISSMLLVSLMLTYSRSSYLVFLVLVTLMAVYRRSFIYWLKWTFLFFILLLILPRTSGEGVNLSRTYSINQRIESTQNAAAAVSILSLIGIGFNNYPLINTATHSHLPYHPSAPDNSYFLLVITTGLIGAITFAYYLYRTLHWSRHHSPILFFSVLTICLHSFTNNSLFYPYAMIWMWLILGSELAKSTHTNART